MGHHTISPFVAPCGHLKILGPFSALELHNSRQTWLGLRAVGADPWFAVPWSTLACFSRGAELLDSVRNGLGVESSNMMPQFNLKGQKCLGRKHLPRYATPCPCASCLKLPWVFPWRAAGNTCRGRCLPPDRRVIMEMWTHSAQPGDERL